MRPGQRSTNPAIRRGTVMILVVMLLFALISMVALVVDLGMARVTQAQLQTVSDAASIEAAWQLQDDLTGTELLAVRLAANGRSIASTEFDPFDSGDTVPSVAELGLGPRDVLLTDGFDLNGDGVADASRTIQIGERVPGQLNINTENSIGGDVVVGNYAADLVPQNLPTVPGPGLASFSRGPAFVPVTDSTANSVLVRHRRTGSTDAGVPGATSGPRLPVLFGAFSHLGTGTTEALQQRAEGYAVRSESIASLSAAVAVGGIGSTSGQAANTGLTVRIMPEAIPLGISVQAWNQVVGAAPGSSANGIFPIDPAGFSIGHAVNAMVGDPITSDQVGYISIYQSIPNDGSGTAPVDRIVAFGLVVVEAVPNSNPRVYVLSASQPNILEILASSSVESANLGSLSGNATSDLAQAASGLIGLTENEIQLIRSTASSLPSIVQAPRVVRNNRIQGGSDP